MTAPTVIDNSTAVERLIAAHDGDVALLWLFRQQRPGADLEEAARALCRTLSALRDAEEKLRRMGLWDASAPPAPPQTPDEPQRYLPPADELPQYTAREISSLAAERPDFEAICREAAQIKGRQLSTAELGVLAGICDYLRFPSEVVFLLLNYCAEQAEARHPGSRPSFRVIQSTAFHWANLELMTHEQVEAHIRGERDRDAAVRRVQTLLQLDGRALTAQERRHIESWLAQGFEDGAIQLAYERTVYNTNSLKWPYMNKILARWHEAGLHGRAAIEAADPPHGAARRPETRREEKVKPIDLDKLRAGLDRI